MNELAERYGGWALVAGAAEGIGKAFSVALARSGMGVILVDRQKEPLEQLAQLLEQTYKIKTVVSHMDLANPDAEDSLMELIKATSCRFLVYNAAYSRVGKFLSNDREELDRYVAVNIRTPLQLVRSFCAHYQGNASVHKGLVFMSSLAGSWGSQLLAPYGASKAFNQILAESLYHELKGDGIHVLACIAGATRTPGYLSSLPGHAVSKGGTMKPETVVSACLKGVGRRPYIVPGLRNRIVYFLLTRILPRRISLGIMNRSVEKLYR
jgi:short-subunit dehydrogenase